MNDYAPLVSAEAVGRRLGLPLPLTQDVSERIEDAIAAAEGKVAGYLNRDTLAPVEVVRTDLAPADGYPLDHVDAWPQVKASMNDRYSVRSYLLRPNGGYDVTFAVGLDPANVPAQRPIVTFVKEDAIAALQGDASFTAIARKIKSVSADGQSVSYEGAPTGDAAGSGLTLASLKRWRRMSIFQPTRAIPAPWPYNRARTW